MDCEAMKIIEKLNEEFDVIMEKNIQLEKENLELHKDNHKLKFKLMIEEDNQATWGGVVLIAEGVANQGHGEVANGIGSFYDWSDELYNSMRGVYPLEKNVILKELYGKNNWENMERLCCDSNGVHPDDIEVPPYPIVLYEGDEWATTTWSADEWNEKLIDTFEGGMYH